MAKVNFKNRTLFIKDNLLVLRGMNSGTVDLIYLDPPFNSKKQYKAPIGTPAEGQSFDDTWRWTDLDDSWLGEIDRRNEALSAVIRAARLTQGDGTAAYLTMMGIRLLELHRVLADTGSIYLHCDPTASHYLKASMDAIFGKDNFRNDIVWFYPNSGFKAKSRKFHQVNDNLLYYVKTNGRHVWNEQREKLDKPKKQPLRKFNSVTKKADMVRDGDGKPLYKVVTDKLINSVWRIAMLNTGPERTEWKTQKPLALLQRIIKTSSNPGDLVLDPFAGCATCCVAAEMEGRKWIGIEACGEATIIIRNRLDEAALGNLGRTRPRAIIKRSVPRRTDAPPPAKPKRTRGYKSVENLGILFGRQLGRCNGCGNDYHVKDFHHDHIHPRFKDGSDDIDNLQLLCGHCNSTKHTNSMEYLWMRLNEQQLPVSPAGQKYLKQSGYKYWRI